MSNFETIFDAAYEGTLEDVRYFIEEKGVDVNSKNIQGDTPLDEALYEDIDLNLANNAEVAQYLSSIGGKPGKSSKRKIDMKMIVQKMYDKYST